MSLARAIDLRPEDLAGRTWAGYVRESTRGQADRYGPGPPAHRADPAMPSGTDSSRRGTSTSTSCRARTPSGGRTSRGCSPTPRPARSRSSSSTTPAVRPQRRGRLHVPPTPRRGWRDDRLLRGQSHRRQRGHLRARGPQDRRGRRLHPPALAQRRPGLRAEVALLRRSGRPCPARLRPGGRAPAARTGRRSGSRSRSSGVRAVCLGHAGATRRSPTSSGSPRPDWPRSSRTRSMPAGRPPQGPTRRGGAPGQLHGPVEPALFDRVQEIRAERRTRHPGMTSSDARTRWSD